MKLAACLCLCAVAWGQTPQPSAQPQTNQAAAPPAGIPAAAGDQWLTGSFDVGYRWKTKVGGNENVYRSVVDLGEGPKLLDADFTIQDPQRRWFDRIDTRAANWGDDPYTTLDVTDRKSRMYELSSRFRNLA